MFLPDEDSPKTALEAHIIEESEAEMILSLHEKGVPIYESEQMFEHVLRKNGIRTPQS